MNSVRRRQLFLGAVLAATTATATTAIVGDQGNRPSSTLSAFPQNLSKLSERFVEAKFLEAGVHTFASANGVQHFALKLQPNLAAYAAPTKTDVIFLVDSTASQAGVPWLTSKALTKQLTEKFGAEDRIAIASVAGKVSEHTGFVSAKDAKVAAGLKALNDVTPMGCADLKSAISSVEKMFDNANDRRKVIVYIGDGTSALNPMKADERTALSNTLLGKDIQFFVVPVGYKPDVLDMSGIASATGGAVLRLADKEAPEATTARFFKGITAPVMRNVEVAFPATVILALPGKLPPLRGDQPTLVVGEYTGKLNQFAVSCKGLVNGQTQSVTQTEPVLTSTPDCFFLPSMVRQWKQDKDMPALVRGDLALIYASTQTSFAREDLKTQAGFAIKGNQLDMAAQLYGEAAKLDPQDPEVQAGIRLVTSLKQNPGNTSKFFAQNQDGAKQEDDLLKRTKQAADVEAQRLKLNVEETLKQARKDLNTNPEDALNRLRLLEQEIRTDPNVSEDLRKQIRSRLEGEIRMAQVKAERFIAEAAEKESLLASARRRESIAQRRDNLENKLKTSMEQFHALMADAHFEDAVIKADEAKRYAALLRIPSLTFTTDVARIKSQFALQVDYWDRILTVTRDNYLAAMISVDESAIPFDDRQTMLFPGPDSRMFRGTRFRTWKELGDYRISRWTDPFYGLPPAQRKSADHIQKVLSESTKRFDNFFDQELPLSEVLDIINKTFNVTLVINTNAFRDLDQNIKLSDIRELKVTIPRMPGVNLQTILTYLLADLKKGETPLTATFIVRGDYIEITTQDRALSERIVRVTDVGALVMPPIDMTFATGGGAGGQNGGGGLGGGGLGGGGLGGGGLGGGGLGGGGLGGGGLGGGGLGGGGLGGGGLGGGGLGGGGLGGGGLGGGGLGGGGLGGGGLGGGGGSGLGGGGLSASVVFSSQATRRIQSIQLQNLIRIVITDADWDITSQAALGGLGGGGLGGGGLGGGGLGGGGLGGGGLGGGGLGGGGLGGGGLGGGGNVQPVKGDPNKDQLFYYDPALALVIRAPSKRTTRPPSPYKRKDDLGGPAGNNPAPPPGGGLGLNNPGNNGNNPGGTLVAGGNTTQQNKPAESPVMAAVTGNTDPVNFWTNAIKENGIDASFTLASVEFLVNNGKADYAAGLLKVVLRQTTEARPWMYEALALALEMSNGNPDEIEQALLSGADLKPGKADGLLQAAKAMSRHNKWAKAIEFCKKSAVINAENPQAYLEALSFAQSAKDINAMTWAVGNLLSRDWPINDIDLHGQARQAAEKLATALSQDGRGADAAKMLQGFDASARRDLVVKLTYQGEAELDLEATDPTGSTCSTLAKQSIGGGSMSTDANRAKTFSVAEAFPGQYTFTVRRIWGRPTGGKATLEIIQNQGTADERIERSTVTLDDESTLTLDLKQGRRESPAQLASPEAFRALTHEHRLKQALNSSSQLDIIATPAIVGGEGKVQTVQGLKSFTVKSAEMDKLALLGRTEVDLPAHGGVGMATSVRTSADGKNLSMKMQPIFVKQNVSGNTLPVIPGSGS